VEEKWEYFRAICGRHDKVDRMAKRVMLDVYAQALPPAKRAAQLKVVEMIRPAVETASVPSCSHAKEGASVSA